MMKTILYYTVAALLIIAGAGLFPLMNSDFLSFRQPYILRKSTGLQRHTAPVVFVNVNIVPMDSERILENQTVIMRDGLIAKIGQSGMVDIPVDALIVEADGKYLMPGLVDMHVHIKEENELLLFVAHGVIRSFPHSL